MRRDSSLETADLLGTDDLPDLDGGGVEVRAEGHGEEDELASEPTALSTRDLLMHALADAPGGDALDEDGLSPADDWTDRVPYSFLPDARNPAERRANMRFPLGLAAALRRPDAKPESVAVTSGSVDALFVQTPRPLEVDTPLDVEIEMLGNHARRFSGLVVRETKIGFVLQLDPDAKTMGFRAAFLELARQPTLQSPRISMAVRAEVAEDGEETLDDLAAAWDRVSERPRDDDIHQDFIHACMRARNLEYAVDRYRERIAGGDDEAQRYLEQVGTILGFYNMQPKESAPLETEGFVAGRTKGWIALALTLILAVGLGQWLLGGDATSAEENEKQARGKGPGLIHTNWTLSND